MESSDVTAVDVLLAAKDIILDGWVQGFYEKWNGETIGWDRCASGAINQAYKHLNITATFRTPMLYTEARRYLQRAIGNFCIVSWNDNPERTKEEVVAAFDEAILLAKEDLNSAA